MLTDRSTETTDRQKRQIDRQDDYYCNALTHARLGLIINLSALADKLFMTLAILFTYSHIYINIIQIHAPL